LSVPERYILRLLSQLDRNPLSPYYGCFHRDFWHYRMASDFPSAVFQMGVLSLALLYARNLNERCYRNRNLREYLEAAVRFWASIQEKDGSFNEWYPHEHSHVATAFTTWGISEAFLALPDEDRIPLLKIAGPAFRKAASFLARNVDTLAMNHTAGAAAALFNLHLLTGEDSYLQALEKSKRALLSGQDPEGWYPEYGEFDAGYQSLSIFFLGQYWKRSGDERVLESLAKATAFLRHFIHPDGTIGGAYLSRDTAYLFRYGLHLLVPVLPDAAAALREIRPGAGVTVESVDDRYFIFFFLPDFLLSSDRALPDSDSTVVHDQQAVSFPGSGLLIRKTPHYQIYVNLKKGGAFKLFNRHTGQWALSSLGYMYSGNHPGISATAAYGGTEYTVETCGEAIRIQEKVRFLRYEAHNPLAFWLIPFRIFNHFLERFAIIHRPFERFLKLKKVKRNRPAPGRLLRTIKITATDVEIIDDIRELPPGCGSLFEIQDLGLRFVPSARFSRGEELEQAPCREVDVSGKSSLCIQRRFDF
jgi:hypothetical protein